VKHQKKVFKRATKGVVVALLLFLFSSESGSAATKFNK